jgi:NAD(P)-dependent dehydrogenase (short-subunit alcohol dehydrogenase family)
MMTDRTDNQLPTTFLSGSALILGASSGMGEACALELSACGMDIFGVHLDRRSTLANVDRITSEIEKNGRKTAFYNINAADPEKRQSVLNEIEKTAGAGSIRILIHSLAFGTLKPLISPIEKETVSSAQIDMTLDVMANSLVYWTQDITRRGLMGEGASIYALTSAGSSRVWKTYGPVSAAKAALESHVRQLALELGPKQISVNAIRAGVTDTPALRKIPGNEGMMQMALEKNPRGRLTTPQDVAGVIALLSHPKANWITGEVIGVDGGEYIVD